MPNTNTPFGFRQISGNGSAPTYEQVTRKIDGASNSTKIYFGDAVIPLSSGYITQATASTVALAGVFTGCTYLSTSQKRTVWSNYWPGSDCSGDVTAYIVNDPNARFVVQAGATAVTLEDVGANIQLNVGTTNGVAGGNPATGISAMFVENPNTTNTLPFRVVDLVTSPPGANGTQSGAYNYVIVGFNNLDNKNLTGI